MKDVGEAMVSWSAEVALYDNSESVIAVIVEFRLLGILVVLTVGLSLPLLLAGASKIRR